MAVGTRPAACGPAATALLRASLSHASPNAAACLLQPNQAPNWGCGGGGMSPFTPTKDLVKRKTLFKRTAYIMQVRLARRSPRSTHAADVGSPQTLEYEAASKIVAERPKPFPAFRPGDVLNLKLVLLPWHTQSRLRTHVADA